MNLFARLRHPVPAAVVDAVVLVVFAAVGRQSHGEGDAVVDVAAVAAPFLIGLAVGWVAVRLWREPVSLRRAVPAWALGLVLGFLLRRLVWDRGLAGGFLVVATLFTAATLLGWRAVVGRVTGARGSRSAPRVAPR